MISAKRFPSLNEKCIVIADLFTFFNAFIATEKYKIDTQNEIKVKTFFNKKTTMYLTYWGNVIFT